MTKITLVIPCFNEAVALNTLLSQIASNSEVLKNTTEVIIVDDGSSDETAQRINLIQKQSERVSFRLIQLQTNRGKIYAQAIGIKNTSAGSSALLMDGDGQHPVRFLPMILSTTHGKIKVGSRVGYHPSAVSRIGGFLFKSLLLILGVRSFDNESEFIYIPAKYVEKLKVNRNLGVLPINEVLRDYQNDIEYFPFEVDERFQESNTQNGKVNSRHSISKLLQKASLILFSNPWKILSRMILILLAITLMIMTYGFLIGWNAIVNNHPTGVATLIIIFSIFFMITWIAIIVILVACLVIREELNFMRHQGLNEIK
jgi:glycosyltransferase involved in cell wall biosynthesis